MVDAAARRRQLHTGCAYYEAFERPKILYQEIQFNSAFLLDEHGRYANNKVFLLPTADLYLLAVLNSPLMWWHNWRYLPHMKDEALNPAGFRMEDLPIAPHIRELEREPAGLERRLAELVNRAYGLTPAEVELLWATAPPRMPGGR